MSHGFLNIPPCKISAIRTCSDWQSLLHCLLLRLQGVVCRVLPGVCADWQGPYHTADGAPGGPCPQYRHADAAVGDRLVRIPNAVVIACLHVTSGGLLHCHSFTA